MPLQPLTLTEIRERLKSPKAKGRIQKAAVHESRLKLHGSLTFDEGEARHEGAALTHFLDWWRSVLSNDDKFGLFLSLLRFPLPTVAFTGQVFAALEKVFDGRNPVQQYDFLTPEAETDWQEYRKAKGLPEFFRKKVFDTAKEGYINSLMVVDLPTEQTGERPEPYIKLLEIDDVVDYEINELDGLFEYVAFEQEGDKLAWFDRYSYRLFQCKERTHEIVSLLVEAPHDLGYCPVHFMWSDAVCADDVDMKESPLSKWLGELDWLLGMKISKRVNEMVSLYPVYWSYSVDCDYKLAHPETGIIEECHGGFLRDGAGTYLYDRNSNRKSLQKCPKCAKSRLIGAGSLVSVPFPDADTPAVGAPVGVVPAETSSLEFNSKEVVDLERRIFTGVTGAENDTPNNQAVNEKQVGAIVDAKTQALIALKGNLEKAQTWAETTFCKLRYGVEFQGCTINLGTEFHLVTAAELLKQYEDAKLKGASMSALDMLWKDYLSARYRFDPAMLQRETVLMHLDPFRHRTASEVMALPNVKPELVYLKFNFSSLIMRFEREQANIMFFGSALQFDRKIEAIQQTLIEYAKEYIGTAPDPAGTAGGSGASS